MVVKATGKGDFGNGIRRIGEELGSDAQACLEDELVGCEAENPFDEPGKAGGLQAGVPGENGGREVVIEVRLKVFHRFDEARWDGAAPAGHSQVAGYADDPNDVSPRVEDGELGRQAPAGFPPGVPVHVQMVHERLARAQDLLVLLGIDFGKFLRKDLGDSSAQQLVLLFEPASLDEGLVDGDITAPEVFNKESYLGHMVKNVLDHRHFHGPALAGVCGGRRE